MSIRHLIIIEPQNVTVEASESTRRHLELFFGGNIADPKLAALVGALDDAVIKITALKNGFISETKHQFLTEQIRIGGKHDTFGLFLTNEFFQLAGDAPAGTGLISFVRQVVAAKELEFSFIRTYGEGYLDDPDGFIGYYVWARFGFNSPLTETEVGQLPENLRGSSDLTTLMMRGGHDWWRQNGTARDMIFSLSEQEISLTVLRNYLREKKIEVNV